MKLFKNIMSRKPEPEEAVGKIDFDMDVEPLRRRRDPVADDTGERNAAALREDASTGEPHLDDPSLLEGVREEEPEEAAGAGWGDNAWEDDDWDEDEDWGDDEFEEFDDNPNLKENIREAMGSMNHIEPDPEPEVKPKPVSYPPGYEDWSNDEEFGRKAIARSHLGRAADDAEDRILERTDTEMTDRETSRRRSAMAHLKAAAAATKADRVLKHVVGRDPTADPEEQSPYRDDLAKVVKPRPTTRPISRPANRRHSETPEWDEAEAEIEAAETDGFDDVGSEERMPEDFSDRFASDEEAIENNAADRFLTDEEDEEGGAFGDEDNPFEEEAGGRFASDGEDLDAHAAAPENGFPDELSESDFADDDGFDDDRFADEGEDLDRFDDGAAAARLGGDEDEFDEFDAEAPDEEDDFGAGFDAVEQELAEEAGETFEGAGAPSEDDEIVHKKIWEVAGDIPVVRDPADAKQPDGEAFVNVAQAAVTGRAGRGAGAKAGRVKTRLLGFQGAEGAKDVFEAAAASSSSQSEFPVGWIAIIEGPGRGKCFTLFNGVSQMGRGEEQAIRLDFGDTSISRKNHAAVAYDDELAKFFLGHGGKSNLVRLNGAPVLSTEDLNTGDEIRIGETTLKFIAFCGEDFTWTESEGDDADNGDDA